MAEQKEEKFDVGIVGVGVGANYGSVLTYYSLYKTIESFGNKVLMVSKIGARQNDPEMQDTHAVRFAKKHYNLSKIYSLTTVTELNNVADTFVIGSDQVWNYGVSKGFGKAFYLDFANDNKRKISYAASFGHAKDFAPEEEVRNISGLMNRFNAISVREDSGVKLARDIYHIPAKQVAEPIFLTANDKYLELAAQSNFDVSEPYLLAYILDPTPEKKAAIEHIAGKLGLKIRIILDGWPKIFEENKAKMNIEGAVQEGVETYDFLKLYANSSYVLTDSFHGTAFALKFGKPFASIGNKRRGMTRFDSMFRLIGHRDRFTLDPTQIVTDDARFLASPDYKKINDALDKHVNESRSWLKAALQKPVGDTVAKPEARLPKTTVATSIASGKVESVARRFYRFLKTQVGGQRTQIDRPSFNTNSKIWSVETLPGATRIKTAAIGNTARGKLIWSDLPSEIPVGTYELTLNWTIRTTAPAVNVHIRNPETGKVKVVGKIVTAGKVGAARTDKFRFTVADPGFSQIMFGALHFIGANSGADISSISLSSTQKDAAAPKQPVTAQTGKATKTLQKVKELGVEGTISKVKAKSKGMLTEPLAVPEELLTRKKLILNVLSDKKVQTWKSQIAEQMPELTFYVGRELKEYMNNKVGGPADILAFPKSIEQVKEIVTFAKNNNIKYTILGRGSNVLVRDGGIRGITILTTELKYFRLTENSFVTGAGSSLIEAAYYLLDNGKSGLEWAAGIPGTIGGAVYMNAGTYTSDVRRSIRSVLVMDEAGEIFSLSQTDIDWGVRYTTFQDQKSWIILEATFKTSPGENLHMARRMLDTVQSRENNMPLESPNHGSTFKWYRAPRLIKQAGLVGTRIGGVKISEKQPGFFINVKQATASDYEALIDYTIAKVYEFSGFMLEPEVEIIGERPHRYKRYAKEIEKETLE